MRRYDEPVEVRRGQVTGPGALPADGPEQFLWRGRLWKVQAVLARWVETGARWQRASRGSDVARGGATVVDLVAEREVWRVEAGPGGAAGSATPAVFELSLDWSDGRWQLVDCQDRGPR